MCIIIDASMFSVYSDRSKSDMAPVRAWMASGMGKIAYSPTANLQKELKKSRTMEQMLTGYARFGKLKMVDAGEVDARMNQVMQQGIRSNDAHIIALAQVSGTTLLAANDGDLESDFKNSELIKQGRIYKNETHKHLLRNRRCP